MSAPRPWRVGVVGTGHWARTCPGAALAAHPDVDLVGFLGRDPDRTRAAAEPSGARAFTDEAVFLDAVDAVAFAVPPQVQVPLALRAAGAGRHLLLEKPLALDVASADALVAATQDAEVAALVHLTYLFQPDVTDWLRDRTSDAVQHGQWEGASARWAGTLDAPGNPYGASAWRREHALFDTGPHALSVLTSLLAPVRSVVAGRGVRDALNVAFEHEGGAGSALSSTVTAPAGTGGSSLAVWGPGGHHVLPRWTGTPQEGFARAVDVLRAAADGTGAVPDAVGVRAGRDAVAVLSAATTAARDGVRVTLR